MFFLYCSNSIGVSGCIDKQKLLRTEYVYEEISYGDKMSFINEILEKVKEHITVVENLILFDSSVSSD